MLDPTKVTALLDRVRREVDSGHLPATQVAVARDGEIVLDETYGAPARSRFTAFSCTKALVGAAVWRLVGEGTIDLAAPAAAYVPAFASNGKDVVTVEQILLHLGGFPWAPMRPDRWTSREGRAEAYAHWRLTLVPGETFMYHPVAGHWVLGDVIEEVTGQPHAEAIHRLVTEPLGLPRLLGIPPDAQADVLDAVAVGEQPSPDEMEQVFGFRVDLKAVVPPEVSVTSLLELNSPDARAVGVPGGGGVMRAADLALLYQAFLHDPEGLWKPDVLADATGVVRNRLPDLWGVPASRTRGGLVVKGDDRYGYRRGFGRTASPRAFGHNGAGGQIAFADPETGLSVAYLTNGLDQHMIRQGRRDVAVASRAADLLATP